MFDPKPGNSPSLLQYLFMLQVGTPFRHGSRIKDAVAKKLKVPMNNGKHVKHMWENTLT
jgi:hypothetical protein